MYNFLPVQFRGINADRHYGPYGYLLQYPVEPARTPGQPKQLL